MPLRLEGSGAPHHDSPGLVAGRYEIEATIARGGMGQVYVAYNRATEQRVALKRLTPAAAANEHLNTLFKLEYQTLSQLRHPNIIEVYEYGVDSAGPYYTMELLDGQDLNGMAPVEYREACRYLRDVAACLSLLHTRRIVHRDLSPKNVRLTSDGKCKLIDFGAMAYAGVATDPVGTAPLIAPEALDSRPLDHRLDLYALGALGYWLLSGRHAYPAERIAELPETWKRAPRPLSSLVEGVPDALVRLIESLIHREPNARPPSAAYVIEALTSIAKLPPQRDLANAMSFVATPGLVGREREMRRLRDALGHLQKGQGGQLLIESSPGVGRTRLLSEMALEARLSGALTLEVDAGKHRGNLDTLRALLRGLLTTAPEAVGQQVERERRLLAHLLPELLHAGEAPAALPKEPYERRLVLGQAFGRLCIEAAGRRPLVMLIDDIHWADDASLAALSELCGIVSDASVLTVASEEMAAVLAAGGGLDRFNRAAQHVRLQALSAGETATLTRGIFGDVPQVERLSRWIHAITLGNPGQNVQLASHLVECGLLRYQDGRWVLAGRLDHGALPPALRDALRTRVAQLSHSARGLAEALALKRGAATVSQCEVLHGGETPAVLAALEELSGLGIVVESDTGYHLARELFRDLLLDGTTEERRRDLHSRLAVVAVAEPGIEARLSAALHMLRAGDETHSLQLFLAQLEQVDINTHDLGLALDAAASFVELVERGGHPLHDRLRLRTHALLWAAHAGAYLDQAELERTASALHRLSGFALAERLQRFLPPRVALRAAQWTLGLRHVLWPRRARGPSVGRALWLLGRLLVPAMVARHLQGRYAAVRKLGEYLRPLSAMPDGSVAAAVHQICRAFYLLSAGRNEEARQVSARVLDMVAHTQGPPSARAVLSHLEGYSHLVIALVQARVGAHAAMDACHDMAATHARMCRRLEPGLRELAHVLRGEFVQARRYARIRERQSDAIADGALEEVTLQLAHAQVASLIGDPSGLKASIDTLLPLTRGDDQLQLLTDAVQAGYLLVSGRFVEGIARAELLLDKLPPWSSPLWFDLRALLAGAYFWQRRYDDALALCEQSLAQIGDRATGDDIGVVAIHFVAADVEDALGRSAEAIARLDEIIRVLGRNESPLLLGQAQVRRACLALKHGDGPGFERHLAQARRWFGFSGHPVLDGRMTQLTDLQRSRQVHSSAPPGPKPDLKTAAAPSRTNRDPLKAYSTPQERAERALELVLNRARADGGMLFLTQAEGPRLVARKAPTLERATVDRVVRATLQRVLEEHHTDGSRRESHEVLAQGAVFPLTCHRDDRLHVIGAIVLFAPLPLESPGDVLLGRLAESLFDAGDARVGPEFQA